MSLKPLNVKFRLIHCPGAVVSGSGEMIFRPIIVASAALVLSVSLFSGNVFSQSIDESSLDFKVIRASHPTFTRFELLTGAYQTMPGLTISHAMYYSAPTFIGFGATVSQINGPALFALFAEFRHLPTAGPISETFAFSLGFWDEANSAGSSSDNGFTFGVSAGLTGRVFGAGDSRLIGEIGYRLIDRPVRDINVLAPCEIGLPCGPLESRKRNIHNLVFSLGVLF